MLTDALSAGGMNIPKLEVEDQKRILAMRNTGASAVNPIDMLATATIEQLDMVLSMLISIWTL